MAHHESPQVGDRAGDLECVSVGPRQLSPAEETLELVRELLERFAAVEVLLERYRPLLELAEKRAKGPKLFGKGLPSDQAR